METYIQEIPGERTIAQIENAIAYEEQDPAHFLKSAISYHNSKFTNLATFETLADTADPGQFKLQLASAPPPAGFAKVWEGPMIVSGTNTMVAAYRQ
ncbi:MAG: hypothetical protein ING75_09480 [Rhodocyclaceae bacterium]|nr:hypothetical protein [Rhodocyclaceae bacterium]